MRGLHAHTMRGASCMPILQVAYKVNGGFVVRQQTSKERLHALSTMQPREDGNDLLEILHFPINV